MPKLRSPLGQHLRDTTPDDATVDRMWSDVRRRTAIAPRRRWQLRIAVAAVAGALLLAGLAILRTPDTGPSGPLLLADHGSIGILAQPAGEPPRTVALLDGSHVILGSGATLDPLDNSAERFDVLLRQGRVDFSVKPGGHRRWIIESGLATVEVVGTKFSVQRDLHGVDVDVIGGIVLVRGERVPGGVQRLTAGGHLHLAPLEAALVPTPMAPVLAPPAPAPAPLAPTPKVHPHAATAPAAATDPAWESLGRDQRYADAYAALGPRGTAAVALTDLSIDSMMQLADVARLSGHPDEAVRVLEQIPIRFPDNRSAALASFTRGRIELDQLKHPANAAEAFAQSIRLGLPAALAEDAGARLVEARHQAGDAAGALSAWQDYAARFPNGRDSARLRQLLGK